MPRRPRLPLFRRAVRRIALLAPLLALVASPALSAASLQPTHTALLRQALSARDAGFAFLDNDDQVHDYVRRGLLVPMRGNDDYFIHPDVRHTAARPEVKVFVERLASQYREACGEKLVVTSLVRPRNHQPWNSDPLSVHPTGMAVDLRISNVSQCRRWLEHALLDLEDQGVIEAARERVIPHYHIVVFPSYATFLEKNGITVPAPGTVAGALPGAVLASMPWVGPAALPADATVAGRPPATPTLVSTTAPAATRTSAQRARPAAPSARRPATRHRAATTAHRVASARRYKVRHGDNLWSIARRHGVSVLSLRRANRLPSRGIKPGQVLAIPAR
ncbi:MAG TPA: DUF5715 family protein [Thermoanaerobaculia bacterium]|nr:DUF5715 family protein [Thermoanaerobaculia bacterium]